MKGSNTNISGLLNSLNSGNSMGSINLSDYASIKNGTYKKLLKSYYAEQKPEVTNTKSASKKKNDVSVDSTGLSAMKKEAEELKSSAEALNKDDLWKANDGKYDTDKIYSAVKAFTDNYNDVLTQSGKVNSKDISQDMKYMKSLTDTMSKALSKIGITVESDGKMNVNEDTVKKANVTSIKNMFGGAVSYGSQIADKASSIAKDTVMNSGIYGSNAGVSSSLSGMFNQWM